MWVPYADMLKLRELVQRDVCISIWGKKNPLFANIKYFGLDILEWGSPNDSHRAGKGRSEDAETILCSQMRPIVDKAQNTVGDSQAGQKAGFLRNDRSGLCLDCKPYVVLSLSHNERECFVIGSVKNAQAAGAAIGDWILTGGHSLSILLLPIKGFL